MKMVKTVKFVAGILLQLKKQKKTLTTSNAGEDIEQEWSFITGRNLNGAVTWKRLFSKVYWKETHMT